MIVVNPTMIEPEEKAVLRERRVEEVGKFSSAQVSEPTGCTS